MLPLRFAGRWRTLSGLLLLFVLLGAVMPAVWLWPDRVRILHWMGSVDKWAHAITFAALAIWFAGQYRPRAYWRIAVGLLAFGLLIELVQRMLSYRTAEVFDLGADAIGIGVGLAVAVAGLGGWSLRFETWLTNRRA